MLSNIGIIWAGTILNEIAYLQYIAEKITERVEH